MARPELIGNRNAATHGMSRTAEYQAWNHMRRRCSDPQNGSYARYGARGIRVCDRWEASFSAFIADMGERPGDGYSLERLDVDGNYEPANCVWATATAQARNRSNNTPLTKGDVTMPLAAWSEQVGIGRVVIMRRIQLGWSVEDALTRPVQQRKPRRFV